MDAGQDLHGLRVLVVEDELLVSMLIEEMCGDLGCEVVGPAATLEAALERSRQADFDVALVDMNLAGVKSDPVLAELHDRSIPFAIASGAGDARNNAGIRAILDKPFSFAQLTECLTKLAAHAPSGGSE